MRRHLVAGLLALLASPLLAQPLSPADAVKKMKLPDGFTVRCVASEPMIRQPLSISFDGTGRLWVLQYLQYPNPAGLKPVKQDQYLRTTWDKFPDPPPKGPKGLDKITICYDPDEHGVFRKSKDFVTGLNLASGFCLANDGVYVVQPPYLLFYPDKNHDDVPDGDPEVLLKGFGLDDTHSLANSLQFGPDGWLYGAAGSTSTSKVANPAREGGGKEEVIEFQQGVWRYHPKSKRFELFSEGGGNTYGLDFDANGQCIAGTNYGGYACLHHLPGAYYVKGWSKHGPLHNPHAYGFFDHVPYKNFKGGHVTCGGIIYDADTYPKEFRGQYIAGNLLSNAVYTHKLTPKGASFVAEHGTDLLLANDDQFRPVDLQLGPDGCVYIADWYDKRAAHLDPIDTWDKTNGRVYKIEYTKPGERRDVSTPVAKPFDIRKKSSKELVELLKHPNMWWRRMARQELTARPADKETVSTLTKWATRENGVLALEALWALATDPTHLTPVERDLFAHPNEAVRAWAIRLRAEFTRKTDWEEFAIAEKSPVVLAELASAAWRFEDSVYGIEALRGVTRNKVVQADPAFAKLVWWGAERIATAHPSNACHLLTAVFPHRAELTKLLARRLICHTQGMLPLGDLALGTSEPAATLEGVLDGLRSPQREEVLPYTRNKLVEMCVRHKLDEKRSLELRARLGDATAVEAVEDIAVDEAAEDAARVWAFRLLAALPNLDERDLFFTQLIRVKRDPLRLAVIDGLQGYPDQANAVRLLTEYPEASAVVKGRIVQALVSRKEWASALFKQLDAGKFPKADVSVDQARAAVALGDKPLTALVEKHFGKLSATAGEKQARIASLNTMLGREKPGDPVKGKAIFAKSCGACHQLFGEGGKAGPDLTTADRKNRGSLLASVVDPSGYIRPEYITQVVNTLDGRTHTGVLSAQSAESITLATYANEKVEQVVVPRKEIDKVSASGVSLMPEQLLDTMSEPEVRDLFAYLTMANPARKGGGEKKDDKKTLKLALVSGSLEYESDKSLPILQKLLEEKYPVECVRLFRKADDDIPGLTDKLAGCDAAVFYTRRLKIDGEQLKAVKAFCESGKPIIGIRTASHGFQTWLEQDKEVFGGNYKNHYKAGDKWELKTTADGEKHPVLKGVKPWASESSLYRNTGVAKDITVLMTGGVKDATEPVTWVREREVGEKKVKQRIFYTSLGHQKDFEEENFLKLLVNGISWATNDDRIGK